MNERCARIIIINKIHAEPVVLIVYVRYIYIYTLYLYTTNEMESEIHESTVYICIGRSIIRTYRTVHTVPYIHICCVHCSVFSVSNLQQATGNNKNRSTSLTISWVYTKLFKSQHHHHQQQQCHTYFQFYNESTWLNKNGGKNKIKMYLFMFTAGASTIFVTNS